MGELTTLKKELAELKKQKEIAKVKKEIKEVKDPSHVKAMGKSVKDFFRPRGTERQALKDLMNI